MVAHEAVGVAEPAEAVHHLGEYVQEALSILVVQEYLLAGIPSGGDVVHRPGVLNPERSCHVGNLPLILLDCMT